MEQTNVKRLLHTLMPFLIMVLTQRLLNMLLTALKLALDPALLELLAFLPAAAVGLALFGLKTFDVREENAAEDESVPLEVRPLTAESLPVRVLSAAASTALMILLMTLLSAAFAGGFSESVTLSPVSAVSLILVHPLAEEYLFRWKFYRSLREMSPIFGCLAQAVMFAILHSTVQGMVNALACGAVLAFTVEETGDWLTALAAHIAVNLRSYLYVSVLAEHPAARQRIDLALGLLGLAALAGVLAIRGRRLKNAGRTDGSPDPSDESDALNPSDAPNASHTPENPSDSPEESPGTEGECP